MRHFEKALAEEITKLVDAGYTDSFSSMAEGTDAWATMMVLALKKKILRCGSIASCPVRDSQTDGRLQHENAFSILEQADKIVYVRREYSKGCLLERNHCLVDQAA